MSDVRYLNLDLQIESRDDLTPIVKEFGEDVVVMYHGRVKEHNRASFEIGGSHAGANEDIQYFCSLIDGLSDEAKKVWAGCFHRTFDLGFESGKTASRHQTALTAYTVGRLAEVGGSVAITIYPMVVK